MLSKLGGLARALATLLILAIIASQDLGCNQRLVLSVVDEEKTLLMPDTVPCAANSRQNLDRIGVLLQFVHLHAVHVYLRALRACPLFSTSAPKASGHDRADHSRTVTDNPLRPLQPPSSA